MEQRLSLAIALVLFVTYLCAQFLAQDAPTSLSRRRRRTGGKKRVLVARQRVHSPARRHWIRGPACRISGRDNRERTRDVRPHRDLRRHHRRRDYRQRDRFISRPCLKSVPWQNHAVIRVYDEAGNTIETPEHAGEFKEP